MRRVMLRAMTSSTNGMLPHAADRSMSEGQHPAHHAITPKTMLGVGGQVQDVGQIVHQRLAICTAAEFNGDQPVVVERRAEFE